MDYTLLSFLNHIRVRIVPIQQPSPPWNTGSTKMVLHLYRNGDIGEWLVFASSNNIYERWKQVATAVSVRKAACSFGQGLDYVQPRNNETTAAAVATMR